MVLFLIAAFVWVEVFYPNDSFVKKAKDQNVKQSQCHLLIIVKH